MEMTDKERTEFVAYLKYCTDAQVRGVFEKERDARRISFAYLAEEEARNRGLSWANRKRLYS